MERAPVWIAVAVAVASLIYFFVGHSYSLYDDAYIYFTYADHAATGCGLRFRCDEAPVEGFTSPLYLALLTLARLATPDLETVAQLAGLAGLVAAFVLMARLALQLGEELPVLVGVAPLLVVATHPHILTTAVNGLETPLAIAAVTWLLLAATREDARGVRLALGVAILCRPECAVFLAALPILPAARRARFWLPLAIYLAVTVALRWWIFADLAPNTYHAKAGGTWRHAELGLAYLRDLIVDFPILAAAPLALLNRRIRPAALFFLAGAIVWLASFLRTGGDVFFYSRLAVPLVPGLAFLAVVGLASLVRWPRAVVPATLAATLALALLARRQPLPEGHGFANVARWSEVADFIAAQHPGALVATVPVGVISYRCNCRVLDLVGLGSREVAKARRSVPPELLGRNWIGHERHQLEWSLAQAPDLLVMSKFGPQPFTDLAATRAGFYADWLLLQEIKAGRAPYELYSPEVAPGLYWQMFRRVPLAR